MAKTEVTMMKRVYYCVVVAFVQLSLMHGYAGAKSYLKPEYIGVKYGQLRKIHLESWDSDEEYYEGKKLVFFAGRRVSKHWRVDLDLVLAKLKEVKRGLRSIDGELYGADIKVIYDFNIFKPVKLYASVNAGLAYVYPRNGWDELENGYAKGQFGGSVGIEYEIVENYFIACEYEVWHVSDIKSGDQGFNNDGFTFSLRVKF